MALKFFTAKKKEKETQERKETPSFSHSDRVLTAEGWRRQMASLAKKPSKK